MRVLFVNQTAQVSGAERSLLALLEGLDGRVERLVACPDGELADLVGGRGIERLPIAGTQASFRLHPLHTSRGLAALARSSPQLRRLARRARPDLIHANTTRASLLALLGRRRSGPPVLAHIRDWVPEGRFPRFVLGTIARRADAVVANSAYVAGQFEGLEPRRPVRVVHNPVDLRRFAPGLADGSRVRGELDIPAAAVVLAVVAQLTPWKGQDDAIRALAELRAAGLDAFLLLAGSAKFDAAGTQFDSRAFESDLKRLVEELGITDRVRFAGERDDVPDVLAAADILLLPSWREAFGRIAVEAMAMAVPVVATEVGGPAEVVRPGVDGLLLPPRDPELWATRLEPLVQSAEARARMGEEGRERARDFRLEAHVTEMLGVYRELAAGSDS